MQSTTLVINIPCKNINAFAGLIKEIEKSAVKNVLFVSSTSVYKNLNKSITESEGMESQESPLLKIESLFRKSKSFKTTILRFGGLIGRSRNPANFFNQKKSIQNPDSPVNLIHQEDCLAIINQVIAQSAWDDVFNCCADAHPTKREFYTQASIKSGYTVPAINETSQTSFKIINNAKVKKALNYKFIHADLMDIM